MEIVISKAQWKTSATWFLHFILFKFADTFKKAKGSVNSLESKPERSGTPSKPTIHSSPTLNSTSVQNGSSKPVNRSSSVNSGSSGGSANQEVTYKLGSGTVCLYIFKDMMIILHSLRTHQLSLTPDPHLPHWMLNWNMKMINWS